MNSQITPKHQVLVWAEAKSIGVVCPCFCGCDCQRHLPSMAERNDDRAGIGGEWEGQKKKKRTEEGVQAGSKWGEGGGGGAAATGSGRSLPTILIGLDLNGHGFRSVAFRCVGEDFDDVFGKCLEAVHEVLHVLFGLTVLGVHGRDGSGIRL